MSEDKVNNLGSKLLSVESIFKWRPVIYEENLNEISCEFEPHAKNEFNFNNFIVLLVQSYRAAETDDIDSALELLNQLDDGGKEYNDESDGGFFESIRNAYYHMVYASKIFLFIKKNRNLEASVMVDKIVPIDDMDKFNKSAIYAMKAAVFALYSNEDTQKAFASIDKALKLDPENPRWNFLKALCLRKIRKMTNPFDVPALQEQMLFKKAFDSDSQNVVYKLYLADVYREISPHAFKRQDDCSHFLPKDSSLSKNLRNNIDEKIKLAVEYYKQAAEEYPDTPYVMFKCAEGLAKLHPRYDFISQAKKLTKDGLKLSPENINGNLVAAFLCEYMEKNDKETSKHLKKCQAKRIFDAECNMIRFLHRTKPGKFDAAEALETLLDRYQEKKRHAVLYSQMVSYYLFVNLDLIKACDAAMKYFSLNCESTCMQLHSSLFVQYREGPFSLIDVLNDEVKFAMNAEKTPKEVKNMCEKYIQFINFQNIKIIQGSPQNFRQQILQGKTIIVNTKFTESPRRNNNFDKGGSRRDTNGGRGDNRDRRNQSTNNHPGTYNNRPNTFNNQPNTYNNQPSTSNYANRSNRPNTDNRRTNNQQPKKPPVDPNKLPSLMDNMVNKSAIKPEQIPPEPVKPPAPVEKHTEHRTEESEDEPQDSKDTQIAKLVMQMLKKQRENKPEKSPNSDDESDESVTSTLQRLVLGGKNTREKYRSNSGFDSDHRKHKDRRRERSVRRRRSDSYSSDESDRVERRRRRSHKRHSSTDSDGHSRYRKSNPKKDRHERDYSRSRRSHRNRHHSSDHRDDSVSTDRRRRGRKARDSISRSPSYSRSRRYSPKREKHSRRDRMDSSDRRDTEYKAKSSKRYDRESTSYEKKYRRRSASREKSEDYRGHKGSRPKKCNLKEEMGKNKRDRNSSQELSSGSE